MAGRREDHRSEDATEVLRNPGAHVECTASVLEEHGNLAAGTQAGFHSVAQLLQLA